MMKSAPIALDAIDRRMLAVLQREGRIAVVALAERVGLSPTPCQRRLARLEEAGIITGYGARIDAARVGQGLQAFVQVRLDSHAEDVVAGFRQAMLARPEVMACYATAGDMDFLLHVVAPDLDAYSAFAMKALLRVPGVKDTRSAFVLETLKPPGALPVE